MVGEADKIQGVFLAALEQPESERAAFLDQQCGVDTPRRQRVEELLAAHPGSDSLLDLTSPLLPRVEFPWLLRPGSVIGPYKLIEEIGHGGMGVVYLAEQSTPVRRRVALKVIKPGMDSRSVISRFEAERQVLSLMDHPHIAKVFDGGTIGEGVRGQGTEVRQPGDANPTPDSCLLTPGMGLPYFVMELVQGRPITQYCDEHRLSLRERIALFVPVCQAIQHAHQKGIIHRDIKPTNVLVAEGDRGPLPKVIDFGVAKALDQPLSENTLFTGLGQIVGTLEYLSPEQAEGNRADIDTRSDVYSLGVLLYELLSGTTPFEPRRLRAAAWNEMLRIVREEEPPRPSTRLSSHDNLPLAAGNRQSEPAKLSGLLRGELDWVVMKTLEKDRSRRYESANALAADLQRYLADEAVQACPPSRRYRASKFVRRYRGSVIAASLMVATLLIATIVSSLLAVRAITAEKAADRELVRAVEAEKLAEKAAAQAQRDFKRADNNFNRSLEAPIDLLAHLSKTRLKESPDLLQDVQASLQARAAERFETYLNFDSEEPGILHDTARAYMHLGSIKHSNQPTEALAYYRRAKAILGKLVAKYPHEIAFKRSFAESCRRMLSFVYYMSKEEASTCITASDDTHKQIAEETQSAEDLLAYAFELMSHHHPLHPEQKLKNALEAQNALAPLIISQPQVAFPYQLRAMAIVIDDYHQVGDDSSALASAAELQQLVSDVIDRGGELTPQTVWEIVWCRSLAGNFYNPNPRLALPVITAGVEALQRLPSVEPWGSVDQHGLVGLYYALGEAHLALGDRQAAAHALRRAVDSATKAESLPGKHPQVFWEIGSGLLPVLMLLRDSLTDSLDEKLPYSQQIVAIVETNAAKSGLESVRLELADSHLHVAVALTGLQRTQEAEGSIERAISLLESLNEDASPDLRVDFFRGNYSLDYLRHSTAIMARMYGDIQRVLRALGRQEEANGYKAELLNIAEGVELKADRIVLNDVAWQLCVARESDPACVAKAVLMASQSVKLERAASFTPRSLWSVLNTLGVAHYRAGAFPKAIETLEEGMALVEGGQAADWFFLAMARWRLGEQEEARKLFNKAVEWSAKNQPADLELKAFQREAAEVLGIADPGAATPTSDSTD